MKVFIACSGEDGVSAAYKTLACDVATMLVRGNHKLVFEGHDTGMMGKCYMTYRYESGRIKAVMGTHDTDYLENIEVDAYEVMPSTFEVQKMLFQSADMMLFLPGGLGSVAEFLSMIEEKRVTKSEKLIVLFNYNDFYTPLLKFIERAFKEGFIDKDSIKQFSIVTELDSLNNFIKNKEEKEEI